VPPALEQRVADFVAFNGLDDRVPDRLQKLERESVIRSIDAEFVVKGVGEARGTASKLIMARINRMTRRGKGGG